MKLRCRIKPYIQPFERLLAFEEMRVLAGNAPVPIGGLPNSVDEFEVQSRLPAKKLAARLAYWETVSDHAAVVSTQVKRESTINIVRNGIDLDELSRLLPFSTDVPLPNRRCLRYGTHGIHEYRGKFFPQLVRALLNIAEVDRNAFVLDPMSGSGTAVAEALLAGHNALGADLNPLSVFITRAKSALLSVDASELAATYKRLRSSLLTLGNERRDLDLAYFASLPAKDQDYLQAWFSPEVLRALDQVSQAIGELPPGACRDFMWVALSNTLRDVSWQRGDDLRVRKEVRLDVELDPIKEFLEETARSVRAVLALRFQEGEVTLGRFEIKNGDAKHLPALWPEHVGSIDAVVTSPPYATALPYLDTDRLSLCYLGLLSRPEHRKYDYQMIGNREISERSRQTLWEGFVSGANHLPASVSTLIKNIEKRNQNGDAGFRRRNLPSLLYKYFCDMRQVLEGTFQMLRPGAYAFFVVGSNHTIAGGTRVDIRTGELLCEIAKKVGFKLYQPVPMEMLLSRDIFRKNASENEDILIFRKPS